MLHHILNCLEASYPWRTKSYCKENISANKGFHKQDMHYKLLILKRIMLQELLRILIWKEDVIKQLMLGIILGIVQY